MVKATQKRTYFLNGGPYDGQTILLATPTTLVFTTRNMTGRYRPGKAVYPSNHDKLFRVNKKLEPVDIEGYTDVILIWEKH